MQFTNMIIDTHVHLGNLMGFNMNEDMIIESMERYHVDYSIVSNGDSGEYDHSLQPIPLDMQISQADSFRRSIRFARKYPNKIGIMPWIKPATEYLDEEFKRLFIDNIDLIHGIKVHPFHSKMFFDSPLIEPYIELARKYKIPVVSHTGGCEEADPKYVYRAAFKYPDVDFVMVHMGLGTDNIQAIEYMSMADNLFADTTWVPITTTLEVIKRYGSKRIVFGSDNPIDGVDTYYCNKAGEPSLYLGYFNNLEEQIGKEAYDDLMYRNALRIFHIDQAMVNSMEKENKDGRK